MGSEEVEMNWREALSAKKPILTDGACGTELHKRGWTGGEASEKAILDRPDAVREIAQAYVRAGSDIVLTNTFGGTRIKLAKAGLDAEMARINRSGAELSRQAAGEGRLVFGSMGPTGEMLEPLGDLAAGAAEDAYAGQAAALAEGGVDGLVVETMSDLGEALAALRGARKATDLPVVVCMAFEEGAKGYATMMGVRPGQAAREFDAAGADVVGANCGVTIAAMVEVVRELRSATDKPIWAKPNAGKPELVDGATVYRETVEEFIRHFPRLVEAGAHFVGGCCGTTPEHIRLLARERDGLA